MIEDRSPSRAITQRTSRRRAGSTTRGTSLLTTISRSQAASARRHQSRRAESLEGPSPSPTLPQPSIARPRGRTPPGATTSARHRHGGRITTTSTPWSSTIRSAPSTTATGAAGTARGRTTGSSGGAGVLPSARPLDGHRTRPSPAPSARLRTTSTRRCSTASPATMPSRTTSSTAAAGTAIPCSPCPPTASTG